MTLTPIKLQKLLQKKMLTLQLSVSNIILRTDNSKLNVKRCKVSQILSELCHGKMIYYKNFQKPTCIALIFTNMPQGFQSMYVIETRLSDFHLIGGERGACVTSNYRNPVRKFTKFPFTEPIK